MLDQLIENVNNKLRSKTTPGVVGFFDDDHECMVAARKMREAGYRKFDAITPFPVHGMEEAVGIERSPVPWVTFFFGLMGAKTFKKFFCFLNIETAFGLWHPQSKLVGA